MGGICTESPHAGRRARLRRWPRQEGLAAFEDHQVLELLLLCAISRRDTNEFAHLLLSRDGPRSRALDVDVAARAGTEGIGEGAAPLLSLVPAVARRCVRERCRRPERLKTGGQAAESIVLLTVGRSEDAFCIVPALVVTAPATNAHVDPRHLVEVARRYEVHVVALTHNHPTGTARPTNADHRFTKTLVDALGLIGINVLDHLVVVGEDWLDSARAGDLPAAPCIDQGGA